ncbi:MAG: flagellar FlbD family protein [Rhodopirellula sp. JB044]|uniref:flagellar FlbD family protein n=1 Tax=Rhodopirellula sp. JB044 TaxID=3342844 RepID=UPI00370B960F
MHVKPFVRHQEVAGGPLAMIKLTRLDGETFILNAELIRYVDRRGDTFVTLSSGERIVVREQMDEVVDRAIAYQQQKHFLPPPPAPLGSMSNVPTNQSL